MQGGGVWGCECGGSVGGGMWGCVWRRVWDVSVSVYVGGEGWRRMVKWKVDDILVNILSQ